MDNESVFRSTIPLLNKIEVNKSSTSIWYTIYFILFFIFEYNMNIIL